MKVFIVGAGQMGLDIGHVVAKTGHQVVFRDINQAILDKACAKLNKALDKLVAKGKMTEETKDEILGRVSWTEKLEDAADADLVIEAATENLQIKLQLFADLDKICKPECVIASNTSSISITLMAGATNRQDKFIGMHFFNPATVMKLVEVIKGYSTSEETFKLIWDLALEMGKDPISVNEGPGFVVNRILVPMLNEACFVLEEGLATKEDIDKGMRLGCNHPMGPLTLADFVGLDTLLHILDVFFEETQDSKYRASRLLRKMVRAGKYGVKSGEGFYKYN